MNPWRSASFAAATEELDALDVRTLERSRLLKVRRTFDG